MLKQLKLQAELKQRKNELSELLAKKDSFNQRRADLETALEEAETNEDISLVEGQIDELEQEIADSGIEDKESNINNEITRIEGELEEIGKRTVSPEEKNPQPQQTENRGGLLTMKNRGLFYGLDTNTRNSIVEQEDVQSFLKRCREFKGKTRGVTGAELEIPDVFLGLIKDNLHKYSKLVSKVNLKPVSGKARQTIGGTIPEAIWTEMVANLNELEISFNQVEVDGYKVGGYIAIPNSTLDDSNIALAAEILEALAQGIGLALDKAILFGTGVRMPLGIAARLAQTSQPGNWGANAPEWTDLHTTNILKWDASSQTGEAFFAALFEKLSVCKSNYSNGEMFWCMNTKTKGKLMSKAITFNAAGALTSSVSNTMPFVGGEIVVLDFLADGDIIGGYGSLYLLAERAGSSFANSDAPRFIQDQTVFKGTARYDGMPVFGEGFVLVNINNTNPTTSAVFAGDEANQDLVSLSELKIGATPATLFPPFNKDVLNYHCKVTAHANKVTATAYTPGAAVVIKNGAATVNSGSNATFAAGENTLTVEVTNGNAVKRTYTVVVEDVTA